MKQAFLAAIAIATSMFFKPTGGYVIKGHVNGAKQGLKVFLASADSGKETFFDSTALIDGRFEFKGDFSSARFCTVYFRSAGPRTSYNGRALQVFVEAGEINVEAQYDSLSPEHEAVYGVYCLVPSTVVRGSAPHDQLVEYAQGRREMDQDRKMLYEELAKVYSVKAKEDPAAFRRRLELAGLLVKSEQSLKAYSMSYVASHPPSEVTALIASKTLEVESIDADDIKQLQGKFAAMPSKGVITKEFEAEAEVASKTSLGTSFSDFTLKDSSGKMHQLSQFIGKGKYVMVDCWASWCGPCRADIPHLREMYKLYHDKGFEIISVSFDDNAAQWKKALRVEKMPWVQLSDRNDKKSQLAIAYRIKGIPTCFLFDPAGKLVSKNMRGPWMDSKLIELYGDLLSTNSDTH